ncbi:MAG: esterase-like activity of phytase family protein [Dongiaceae bacterium]
MPRRDGSLRDLLARFAIAVFALALLAGPVTADPLILSAQSIELDPLHPGQRTVGPLEFLAGYELSGESEYWGGLSGMVVSADGKLLTAIADTGRWYRIGMEHDSAGRLTGFMGAESGWLLDTKGQPPKRKVHGDAEAITALPDGNFLVAYENRHRLWLYKQPVEGNALAQTAVVAGAPSGIAKLPRNGGIEAMARLPSGEYLLLSESGITADSDRLGWIGRRGKWAELRLAPMGSFEPSDLALLPDGDLLLLERRVSLLQGFVSRLSMIEGAAVKPGAILEPRQMAILSAPLSVDNFEAVAVRRAPDGSTLIYVLSDDNQRMLQRTLLLQFRWKK